MLLRSKSRFMRLFDRLFVENTPMILCLFLLAFTGAFVYRNSFGVPFLFDDWTQIVFNPAIKSLEWPWQFLQNNRRPVLYTTLAFDFHQHGLNTFGYHVFNVRVHMLAAMALFLLIYKTCRLPKIGKSIRRDAVFVALGASLLWLCHPIQTQAVTYIIQRAESLMALFFIVALYCSAQYLTSRHVFWLAGAGFAALLCGLTKEVALALPIVVLLYDRTFISNSFRFALKRNCWLYFILSLTWVVMLVLFFTTEPEKIPTAGFAIKGMTVWEYVSNQPRVVLHYLRLAIWPDPLIFDYHWPLVNDMAELLPSIVVIVAACVVLVRAYQLFPVVSFLGLSFFMILSPSSSIIPLKDLIWEYRMYLSLSCLAVVVILLLKTAADRFISAKSRRVFFVITVGVIVLILGGLTNQRNKVYRSEETLWLDVVKKQPDNMRIWNDLGSYYFKEDKYRKAEKCFLKALSLNPTSAEIVANVAMALAAQKKFMEAIPYAQKAIELSPNFAVGHYNFGILYLQMGRYDDAVPYFEKSIELGLKDPVVFKNLKAALRRRSN